MAERVVHRLEAVEIDEQDRDVFAGVAREFALETLERSPGICADVPARVNKKGECLLAKGCRSTIRDLRERRLLEEWLAICDASAVTYLR
jgi:hypothetical protein